MTKKCVFLKTWMKLGKPGKKFWRISGNPVLLSFNLLNVFLFALHKFYCNVYLLLFLHFPHNYIKFTSFFHWKFLQIIIFFRMFDYLRNLLPLFYWFSIRHVEVSSFSHCSCYCIFIHCFGIWAFRVYKLNLDFQTLLV